MRSCQQAVSRPTRCRCRCRSPRQRPRAVPPPLCAAALPCWVWPVPAGLHPGRAGMRSGGGSRSGHGGAPRRRDWVRRRCDSRVTADGTQLLAHSHIGQTRSSAVHTAETLQHQLLLHAIAHQEQASHSLPDGAAAAGSGGCLRACTGRSLTPFLIWSSSAARESAAGAGPAAVPSAAALPPAGSRTPPPG